MPESKNTNDTTDETVEPTDAVPEESDDAAAGADAAEVQDEVEADDAGGEVRVVEGVEVADDLVDVPEELTEDDSETVDDEVDDSDDTDDTDTDEDAGETEDADEDAEGAVVAGAAAGATAKAGKDVATKAKKDGKPGKTVKPPKVKKAEKAKKKAGPAPRKMPKQRRWVAPLMLACWLIGLAWLVVFYVAGSDIPYMKDLNNWNLLIGMALIALGFVVSTQWV